MGKVDSKRVEVVAVPVCSVCGCRMWVGVWSYEWVKMSQGLSRGNE